MKVLFVSNIPTPYRVDFFNELGKMCQLTVAFEGKKATDRDAAWKAENYENFHAVTLKGIRTGSDRFFCPGIIGLLKKDWDFIVLGCYYTPTSMLAIEYLKLKKKKFAIEADGGKTGNDTPFKYKVKKHFISAADLWFSSGKTTTEYFVFYGAKRERCFEYPFTSLRKEDIYKDTKQLLEAKKKYTFEEKKKYTVLAVGRFLPLKRYDVLLKAVSRIQDMVDVYIVGGKPTKEYLDICEELILCNVTFVDFKSKEELSEYFLKADLFVHPSETEAWGLVVNEAMAYGLPVIATEGCVAGLELIKDGYNGYLVEAGNDKELTDKIILTVDSLKTSNEMSENALKSIQKYTISKMAEAHYSVFCKEMKDL